MKKFLLYKTECKKFRGNERYSLRTSAGKPVIAVVPQKSAGDYTASEIEAVIGKFRVEMYFFPGMTHYETGEGHFWD